MASRVIRNGVTRSEPDAGQDADEEEERDSSRPAGRNGPGPIFGWTWLERPRARRAVGAVLAAEVITVAVFSVVYRPFDLNIYLWGGRSVTHGLRLYQVMADHNWFTYPPFSASLFTPLDAVPQVLVQLAWGLGTIAAIAWAALICLRLAGYRPSRTEIAAVTAAGVTLEPLYHTLFLGQVNVFLMALVLADVWRAARGRPAGIGTGLATAIKLTPAIFIVLFLLTRRIRDAVTAVVTVGACILIGFLVDPGASRLYWSRLFYDTRRVNVPYISNQSVYSALVRIMGGTSHVGGWFPVIPLILGVTGLVVAVTLARRGDWLAAAAVTGGTGLLVSPVSWTHHWVWILPALIVLLRGGPGARIGAAAGYVLFVLAPMWWTPHPGAAGHRAVRRARPAHARGQLLHDRRAGVPRLHDGAGLPASGRPGCGRGPQLMSSHRLYVLNSVDALICQVIK
jgi:alpha-1,2-mannosyltransferase